MNKNRIAFIAFGGLLVGAGAVGAAACSSDTTTGTPTPTVDGSKSDGGGTGDDGSTTDDGSVKKDGGGGEAGKDCGSAPTLHPSPDAGGIYCPFQADAGPDGGSRYCPPTSGEHCCMYPQAANKPSTCNTSAQACDIEADAGGADFGCDEPADCPSNQKCCLSAPGTVQKDPVCYNFGSRIKGSHCAANCPTDEFQVCSSQADCTGVTTPAASGGTNCTAFSTKAKEIGACLK